MKLKKVLVCALALGLLSGCGGDKEEKKEETKAPVSTEESVEKDEAKEEPESKEEPEEVEEVKEEVVDGSDDVNITDPKMIGKTVDEDDVKITVVKAGKADNTFEKGPMKIEITGVSLCKTTLKDEEAKAVAGDLEEAPTIVVSANIENTTDKKVNFFFSQSKIATNTQEQIEPDSLFSDIDGEYLGNVKQDIAVSYFPESDLEDINEIKLYTHAPYISDGDNSDHEDLVITIKFNDKGEVESIS